MGLRELEDLRVQAVILQQQNNALRHRVNNIGKQPDGPTTRITGGSGPGAANSAAPAG